MTSFGIPPQVANDAVTGVTQMVMKKSTPKAAEGLISALPKEVTDKFDDNEKQNFTTTQISNIDRYDLLKQLSGLTGIKDIDKLDDFADSVLDSIKKNSKINVSDGLSQDELFQAMKDLSKDHLRQT